MSRCSQGAAKTGRLIQAFSQLITVPSGPIISGKCISDKLIIDCAAVYPGGTAIIEQADIIEQIDGGGTKARPLCKLFLRSEDFTAQAAGSAFSVSAADEGVKSIIAMAKFSAEWVDIDAAKGIQSNRNLGYNLETLTGRMIYGQLVSASDFVFSSNTKLTLKLYIRKD